MNSNRPEDSPVLLLGEESCDHIQAVAAALDALNVPWVVFDTAWFPQQAFIAFDPAGDIRLRLGERCYPMSAFRSVYWRTYRGVAPRLTGQEEVDRISRRDATSLLESLLCAQGPAWFNGYEAWAMHKLKPLQLARIAALGVPVPATLMTNDPESAPGFANSTGPIIHKPVFGGSETSRVTPELLEPSRLQRVFSASPVTLQRLIPGDNVRTFVIAGEVFSVRITAGTVDFRMDPGHDLEVMETPEQVADWSRSICRALSMNWTAIDWRMDEQGNYYFLEANPSPMFTGLSRRIGVDVAGVLARALVSAA